MPVPPRLAITLVTLVGFRALASAAPLTVDLTVPVPPPAASPHGPGTAKNLRGEEITADSQSFFLNGKPWIPVVGEFHYARYPQAEWRDELQKMRAGGINTVSTYVFWIHHEEERGKFDWSGQRSLRDFLKACQETGLKVVVRMGPWCHGEVRNGGFPDWVQHSGTRLREKDPAFLKLVEPFFQEQAKQMQGMLWKDGGPVISVQMDNECDRGDYLLALKDMARAAGVDVPVYVITGWQGGLPKEGFIPLFGGYTDGFWGGSREGYRKEFMFNEVRAMNDLGAQMTTTNPVNSALIARFPYACVEIGGGMMSGYGRRLQIPPASTAALALGKLGSGNNMPGFYMYHGGTNPDGKLSTLHEAHPNQLPTKNYDFQAPLGSAGQAREHYFILREQHLFLQDFGPRLARMPAYFPDQRPAGLKDFDTLRWAVRSDGQSGFLFFSNQQPYEPLPEHRDVQFEVKTKAGPLLIPRQPMTIPSGSTGILPVNLDCDGVTLEYATAQPLCRLAVGPNASVFFFTALEGIAPELAVRGADRQTRVQTVQAGPGVALSVKNPAGNTVAFVVLSPEQGRQFSRAPFGGQERALLTRAIVTPEAGGRLRLQGSSLADLGISIFPPVPGLKAGGTTPTGKPDGIFSRFPADALRLPPPVAVTAKLEKPAGPKATSLKGNEDAGWEDAAVYTLNLPAAAANRRLVLNVDYVADAARLYVGDRLVDDDFFNGEPFPVALWRIPPGDWPKLRLKVLPYSEGLNGRLPAEAKAKVEQAKGRSALDQITVSPSEQFSLELTPAAP